MSTQAIAANFAADEPSDLHCVGITKHYPDFSLKDVALRVPKGAVVGLVGQNGAGKTTLMKALLGTIRVDAGEVELFGQRTSALSPTQIAQLRGRLGFVSAVCGYPGSLTVAQVRRMYELAYPDFDQQLFEGLCRRMGLETGGKKTVKDLSRGMGMKLQLACALACGVEVLVMDEPTAGLDPIVRDEVLDLIRAWMESGDKSALISSHITSDLEKIADYVVIIDDGQMVFAAEQTRVTDEMGVARLRTDELERVLADDRCVSAGQTRVLRDGLSWALLVEDRAAFLRTYPDLACDRATIDDVMALVVKGEVR